MCEFERKIFSCQNKIPFDFLLCLTRARNARARAKLSFREVSFRQVSRKKDAWCMDRTVQYYYYYYYYYKY